MPTKSYEQFRKTIQRSDGMLNFYIRNKKMKGISFPTDIVRGAVVLSVAAFDAYVSNVFIEKLIPFLKNNPIKKDMVEFLEKAGLTTKLAIELYGSKDPYQKIRKLADNYYMTHATQTFDSVNELFQRYRVEDIVNRAAEGIKRKDVVKSIEELLNRRHQIAHNGDYTQNGKIHDIDDTDIKKKFKTLEMLVESLDVIIEKEVK